MAITDTSDKAGMTSVCLISCDQVKHFRECSNFKSDLSQMNYMKQSLFYIAQMHYNAFVIYRQS